MQSLTFQRLTALVSVLLVTSSPVAMDSSSFDPRPGPRSALATNVLEAFHGKDRRGKDGPMRKIGPDLINTYFEFDDFRKRGGRAVLKKPFKPGDPLIRLKGESIVIDAVSTGDVNALRD